MFQLADTIDYTNIEIPDLYTKPVNTRFIGSGGTVCGWGSVLNDQVYDETNDCFEDGIYSESLHCAYVFIHSTNYCIAAIEKGDFRRKLLCGVANNPEQMTTLVITLGNLCINIHSNSKNTRNSGIGNSKDTRV